MDGIDMLIFDHGILAVFSMISSASHIESFMCHWWSVTPCLQSAEGKELESVRALEEMRERLEEAEKEKEVGGSAG